MAGEVTSTKSNGRPTWCYLSIITGIVVAAVYSISIGAWPSETAPRPRWHRAERSVQETWPSGAVSSVTPSHYDEPTGATLVVYLVSSQAQRMEVEEGEYQATNGVWPSNQ